MTIPLRTFVLEGLQFMILLMVCLGLYVLLELNVYLFQQWCYDLWGLDSGRCHSLENHSADIRRIDDVSDTLGIGACHD